MAKSNEDKMMKDKNDAALKIQNWFRTLSHKKNIDKQLKINGSFIDIRNEKFSMPISPSFSLGSKRIEELFAANKIKEQFPLTSNSISQTVNKERKSSNEVNLLYDNKDSNKTFRDVDELEKISMQSDKTSSSNSDVNVGGQSKNLLSKKHSEIALTSKYLSEEKLGNVITYLKGVKSMGSTYNVEKNSLISSKSWKKSSQTGVSSNLQDGLKSDNKQTLPRESEMNESNNKSSKEQKKSMKKQYEETISRHLAFIDQLINDKKGLTEELKRFQDHIQDMTEKFQKELEAREGRHAVELKKLKDVHAAAEQIKREQWIKTEANRIKELTAKGFEPALQKLIAQHRTEISKLKNLHKEEMKICQEDELAKYNKKVEELRKESLKEIAFARKEEREVLEKEFERRLSEEIEAMNKEKENLNSDLERERRYMEKRLIKQEEEFKKMQSNLNKVHTSAISVLKREFETARNEQEKRHEVLMNNLAKQYDAEKEEWGKEFFKKHQTEFEEKEKELKNKLKTERDRDIDLVLQNMVDEREKEIRQNKIDMNNQIKKLKEKHKQELANIETSEKHIYNSYNEIKRYLFAKESENKTLLSQLSQAENIIKELNEAICKRNEEKSKLTDIVRQEVADKMASFESENLKFKQEICNLKAKFKVDVENIQSNAKQQLKLKEDEVEEVHKRVKEIIEKRVRIENDLKKERDAAVKRADYIQGVLLEQNKSKGKNRHNDVLVHSLFTINECSSSICGLHGHCVGEQDNNNVPIVQTLSDEIDASIISTTTRDSVSNTNSSIIASYTDISISSGAKNNETSVDTNLNIMSKVSDVLNLNVYYCKCHEGWYGPTCASNKCSGRQWIASRNDSIADGLSNYSDNQRCTWLLGSGDVRTPIYIQFEQFATESNWDYLYVHDGSSAWEPMVAAISGVVRNSTVARWPELRLTSGYAYIYLITDSAFNSDGFVFYYRWVGRLVLPCALDDGNNGGGSSPTARCSAHGTAIVTKVQGCVGAKVGGSVSHAPNQPASTCAPILTGSVVRTGLVTVPLNIQDLSEGPIKFSSTIEAGQLSVIKNVIYVSGGVVQHPASTNGSGSGSSDGPDITKSINGSSNSSRSSCSSSSSIMTTNELWSLECEDVCTWRLMNSSDGSEMLSVSGHTMHAIDGLLYLFFGYNPDVGYLNFVQKFDLATRQWSIIRPSFTSPIVIISGLFGHSSVLYDASSSSSSSPSPSSSSSGLKLYIHGGFYPSRKSTGKSSDQLFLYDLTDNTWTELRSSGVQRFMHTSFVLHGHMHVYSGITNYNNTLHRDADDDEINDFMVYDFGCNNGVRLHRYDLKMASIPYDVLKTDCNVWTTLPAPRFQLATSRSGHSSNVNGERAYTYGGYSGHLLNDLILYTPAVCRRSRSCDLCLERGCFWCGDRCQSKSVVCHEVQISEMSLCYLVNVNDSFYCSLLPNCEVCMNDQRCFWSSRGHCLYVASQATKMLPNKNSSSSSSNDDLSTAIITINRFVSNYIINPNNTSNRTCPMISCPRFNSCEDCIAVAACMWCSGTRSCLQALGYVPLNLYGSCISWVNEKPKRCSASTCDYVRTCTECLDNPMCGFCDDGSGTGLGRCVEGGLQGPANHTLATCGSGSGSTGVVAGGNNNGTGEKSWHFTECPICQCHGHSKCFPGTDKCISCQDNTTGPNCEFCMEGFWGNAFNGEPCELCSCNGTADSCHQLDGDCHCKTRGAFGKYCDGCEMQVSNLVKHPFDKIGNSCYEHIIMMGYKVVELNMTEEDSRYFRLANFYFDPLFNKSKDIEIEVTCNPGCNLTVLVKKGDDIIQIHHHGYSQRSSTSLLQNDFLQHHDWSVDQPSNVTAFLHLYNFTTPLRLTRNKMEMLEMAKRPFAMCTVLVDEDGEVDQSENVSLISAQASSNSKTDAKHKKIEKLTPVAIEPLANQKSAIVSVLVRLPHVDESYALPDQSAFAFASTLVSNGSISRRLALECNGKSKMKPAERENYHERQEESRSRLEIRQQLQQQRFHRHLQSLHLQQQRQHNTQQQSQQHSQHHITQQQLQQIQEDSQRQHQQQQQQQQLLQQQQPNTTNV
ncbi:hypothetical protein HELRODRAFT_188001 [Helobdella robusta]|uniref:CUB domain-containing protein n=1 Tax=Helobdella robusta TaxID=6412 RepID=T1FPJ3_HELRO|nr:hypothetical protein HELRODRAFT_188001 [Helobdella robusta]ESO12834.1 hypothetical protein HELRODRAFT_188001 [Helobdella robusta]